MKKLGVFGKNGKKGVALVTVLMFMLMATIAATSVYKWLASEDKASAARLTQNEAYQASQAGLNVARAWLAYNGNEAAALFTQFIRDGQHRPISLDSVINMGSNRMQQKFSVLIAGVDTTLTGSLKVKLISTGVGRGDSRYSQVGIYNVEGLYRVDLPSLSGNVDYNYAYFGGSMKFEGPHQVTSMLINGNWDHNDLTVDKDFIVTGNVELSGNEANVGGTTCIGGSLSADNGIKTKSIYVEGNSTGKLREITGDAYFKGDVDARAADFKVGENFYSDGVLRIDPSAHTAIFNGNFCMGDNGSVMFNGGSGHEFRIQKNVWLPNTGALSGTMNEGEARDKKFGTVSGAQVYIAGSYLDSISGGYYRMHQEGDFLSEAWGYISGDYNWRYFVTQSNTVFSAVSGNPPFDCADSLLTFCSKKWHVSSEGCGGSKFKIDDMLTTAYSSFAAKANKVECAKTLTHFSTGSSVVDALNNCYDEASRNDDANLYNGFLVVKFDADQNASPSGTLTGKFIIIYENDGGNQLRLPPSSGTTMLYLKEGISGKLMQSGGDENSPYNYFIYTKKDINSMEDIKASWRGSFYAEAASCAGLKSLKQGALEYDPKVISALVNAEVICKAGTSCGGSDEGEGESGSGSTEETSSSKKDNRWIALAPTLKISLLTQYKNDEYISIENNEVEKGLLVMPRVIYLNAGDRLSDESNRAYNVVYLGGLEPPGNGTASCYSGDRFGTGTYVGESSVFTTEGLHTCRYTEGGYSSDFWVWVVDAGSTSKVAFDTLNFNLGKYCEATDVHYKDVKIRNLSDHALSGGTLYILVYEKANGASIEPLSSPSGLFSLTELGSSNGGLLYKLEIPKNVTQIEDPVFRVTINGSCVTASGFVQLQLTDQVFTDDLVVGSPSNELILLGDGSGPVAHLPLAGDDLAPDSIKNIPECTAYTNDQVVWTPQGDRCFVPAGSSPDNFYGPWLCPLSASIQMAVSDNVDSKVCNFYQFTVPIVENTSDTTFVYASLKKTPYKLNIDIQGLMGTANIYGSENSVSYGGMSKDELEQDAAIDVLSDKDSLLGTCRTGNVLYDKDGKNIGSCNVTVYYGQHYYVRAKGKYFDHWSYSCASKPKDSSTGCGVSLPSASANSRLIAVTIQENTRLQANYTKTGYCFNEDFTRLHPYCDSMVTPKKIGGLTFARLVRDANGFTSFMRDSVKKGAEKLSTSDAQYEDWGYGDDSFQGRDGGKHYCIDQCVTNKAYRFSEMGPEYGTDYLYYYDYYCSVEGEVDETLSIAEKEEKYWSYYDPGISCTDQVDRAYNDWELPWTKNPNLNVTSSLVKEKCLADGNDTYRCIKGDDGAEDKVAQPLSCKGQHPPSLEKPRIYGGYYPQNDPYSPWMKVLSINTSQQTKYGVRRQSGTHQIQYEDGTKKTVKQSYWNIKPYIDRENGFVSFHGTKTSFITLRKQKAGYNGTYTKTFTWNGKGESNDGGSMSAIVFRSNADATSFFLLGINPSDTTGGAAAFTQNHFILCHGIERQMFNSSAKVSGKPHTSESREMQYPLNTGHCVAEDAFANIPWDQIKNRTLQLAVELDGPMAKITFSYSNLTTSEAGTSSDIFKDRLNSTIYISKTFNLEDPKLFGYPVEKWSDKLPKTDSEGNPTHIYQDPITEMKNHPEDYGYVGFIVHNQTEKIFNLSWRSGGSCGGDYRESTGIYCGYETAEVPANTHTVPIRYVYDYCPDKGECRCAYKYSLNGGPWVDEMDFVLPPEGRKYPYGALRVMAECEDENAANNTPPFKDSTLCNGFTTYVEGGPNVCYDNYTIFDIYRNAGDPGLFTKYNSRITHFNNDYSGKIDRNAGPEGVKLRQEFCVDTEENLDPQVFNFDATSGFVGTSHYRSNGFCSNYGLTNHGMGAVTIDGVKFWPHQRDNNVERGQNYEGNNLMMVGNGRDADPFEGVIMNYLQLSDTIDNTNTKQYLNLKGSDLVFRLYQNNVVDDIRVYLVDDNNDTSNVISLDEPGLAVGEDSLLNNMGSILKTRNLLGDYCDIYDHRISAAEYSNLNDGEKRRYHQEFCQLNVVWVRDLKRFARSSSGEEGHSWSGLYPYRNFRIPLTKFTSGKPFDPTRVSRIYFEVENDRGGGIHIGQLKVSCPSALDVLNCQTSAKGTYNNGDKSVNEGQSILFSANVPGATYCKLNIHQNDSDPSYEYISGYPTEWFACNNDEDLFMTDSLGLKCDNPTGGNCVARFTVVARNSSDEMDSCTNNTNRGLKVTVNNTKYICYGYNTAYEVPYGVNGAAVPPIAEQGFNSLAATGAYSTSLYDAGSFVYDGSGNISMGIDFNDYNGLKGVRDKLIIKLRGPDGQIIRELMATDNPNDTASRFARCAQRQDGKIYRRLNNNTARTFRDYVNLANHCAFFQFDPTEHGSGDYTLLIGNSNVEACKVNVDVPARRLKSCVLPQSTVNKNAYVVVAADGEYLDGVPGSLKFGSKSYPCTYAPESEGATRGTVTCGFAAPDSAADYPVEIVYGGLSLDCGTMTVATKPTPTSCDARADGHFVAKISNPQRVSYQYRLVRCADVLGNGCSFESADSKAEGSLASETIQLDLGVPSGGSQYVYFFQVSATGCFEGSEDCPRDVESCSARSNSDNVSVECEMIPNVAGMGKVVNFTAKNAKGVAANENMTIKEGENVIGNIEVRADEYGSTYPITAGSMGVHTYSLVDSKGRDVCKTPAILTVSPITADCDFDVAEVGKGAKARFKMSNITNLDADMTLTLSNGSETYSMSVNKSISQYEYDITAPSTVGSFDYTVTTSDGTNVCSTPATLSVVPLRANTCNFQLAEGPEANQIVDKVMTRANYWNGDHDVSVKFTASDFQNLNGNVNAKLRCDKKDVSQDVTVNPYNLPAVSGGFSVSGVSGDMTCVLSYGDDEICRATISVAKTLSDDDDCMIGNDNGIQNSIQNAKQTPGTHFYIYYKGVGEPSSIKVMSPPSGGHTYDAQEDRWSKWEAGCGTKARSGYECVTVYPNMGDCHPPSHRETANFQVPFQQQYVCAGFVPSNGYEYTLYVKNDGYYGIAAGQCTKTLNIVYK